MVVTLVESNVNRDAMMKAQHEATVHTVFDSENDGDRHHDIGNQENGGCAAQQRRAVQEQNKRGHRAMGTSFSQGQSM